MPLLKRLSGGSKNRSGLFDPSFTDYGHEDDHQSGGNIVHLVLPGSVMAFAGGNAVIPDGWLKCDGQAVSRSEYATLFEAISTTWGTGDGSTTFNVPDLRNVFLVGAGATAGNLAVGGGSWSHDHNQNGTTGAQSQGHTHAVSGSVGSAGAHTHGSEAGHTHSSGSLGTNDSLSVTDKGTGVSVASLSSHTHAITGSTGTAGAHTHASDGSHDHGAGSLDTTGVSQGHDHGISGTTGTANPPFKAVHWIIKT